MKDSGGNNGRPIKQCPPVVNNCAASVHMETHIWSGLHTDIMTTALELEGVESQCGIMLPLPFWGSTSPQRKKKLFIRVSRPCRAMRMQHSGLKSERKFAEIDVSVLEIMEAWLESHPLFAQCHKHRLSSILDWSSSLNWPVASTSSSPFFASRELWEILLDKTFKDSPWKEKS